MKRIFAVTVVILLTAFEKPARAQEIPTTGDVANFLMGYLTGHAAHETGHQVAAWATGVKVTWKLKPQFPYILYKDEVTRYWATWRTRDFHQSYDPKLHAKGYIAIGGFLGECISSEVILASSDLKRDDGRLNYFLLGWVMQTVVNPIIYTIQDGRTTGGYGDLKFVEETWHGKKATEAFIIAHAAVTLTRVMLKIWDEGETLQISSTPTSVNIQISF